MIELVKIHDPKKPGDFRLTRRDWMTNKDKLFSEPLEKPKAAQKPKVKRAPSRSK